MTAAAPFVRGGPYQGLVPYAESDAPFLFGREVERRIVEANFSAKPLTVLYGPSGVGKSSLLRAGVAADLRDRAHENIEARGKPELAIVMWNTWMDDPVRGIVGAVGNALAEQVGGGATDVSPGASLGDAFAEATARSGELYVILDQLEEFFLYHRDDPETFAGQLAEALGRRDVRAQVLLSIREDLLAALEAWTNRLPSIFQNALKVEHLDLHAARAAIVGPLEHYNRLTDGSAPVEVEPELVEAVLAQLSGGLVNGEGRLEANDHRRVEAPFLQIVMARLWDEEQAAGSTRLRLETFERLGGASRISQAHLDDALASLSAEEQAIAAEAFRFLVTTSGTKIAFALPDLAEYVARPIEDLAPVLEQLAAARILRYAESEIGGPPRFEIFHDLLGPALRDWRARRQGASERQEFELEMGLLRQRLRLALAASIALAALVVVLAILLVR